ncbi:dCTP deaminase [Elusimicrobiota bacterium]
MKYLTGSEIISLLENIVYEKTQVHEYSVDITVSEIYRISSGAELDFGGSEFKPAVKEKIEPVKKDTKDKYGWWELDEGYYQFKFNEILTLSDGQRAVIQPHPHLRESGAFHNTLAIEESGSIYMPVAVMEKTSIKENARTSEMRIWEG